MQTKKEVLGTLVEKFPGAQKLIIYYNGAGDDFDSFSSLAVLDGENKNLVDLESWEKQEEFIKLTQNYIFDVIFENANCQPDFNNEGSTGTVTFDLLNKVVTLENSYWEDVTEYPDDDEHYEYEEAEDKCDPEVF